MLSDRQALMAAICAHPDEDTPRLAFADWLDEQGNADDAFRADFIRTHCRLAREEPYSLAWRELNDHWAKLANRAYMLKTAKKLEWVRHLEKRAIAFVFERGMVGEITVYSKRFVEEGGKFFDQDPIRTVKFATLTATRGAVKPAVLFACPHLARAARLNFEGSGLTGKQLETMAKSPHLMGLRGLVLSGYHTFPRDSLPKLLRALPALTELDCRGNANFKTPHAQALAACTELAQITVLDLNGTAVGPDGILSLVQSRHAANLTELGLTPDLIYDEEHDYAVGPRGNLAEGQAIADAIAASTSLTRLQSLDLSGRVIGEGGLKTLASAKNLPALRRLRLAESGIGIKGVEALANSPVGQRLLLLDVALNGGLRSKKKVIEELFPNTYVRFEEFAE